MLRRIALALLVCLAAANSCSDPEPPAAAAAALAPAVSAGAAGAPPAPRAPWVFPFNASEAVVLPVQPPLPVVPRSECPHAAAGLRSWCDPALALPLGGGADVTLPAGAPVLLSACCLPAGAAFGLITIPAGAALVLSDSPLSFSARGILVRGALTAGAPTCRLRSAITITLVGARPAPVQAADDNPDPLSKGIVVEAGGTLDLHAERFEPTWTRLAAPAARNDSWLFTQQQLNWEPGQTFIVTTTAVKDARDYSETEERVIAEVRSLANGMGAIRFEPPLNFSHYAGREYQAEVGLLSRRLTVAGAAANSPPTDPPTRLCPVPAIAAGQFSAGLPCANDSLTGYGGHIMVAGAGSAGRLSSVLLRRMGQTNYLARYPFHMHMLREGGRHSYITGSAIWQSYYRCVSIHGTNSSSVWGNVAHDAIGHCYYFEDGVEENNTVAYNLASLVHPLFGGAGNFLPASGWGSSQDFRDNINVSSTLLLPADATASGYYITNKMNRIIGNAASGGWSGFAFPAFPAPIGLHRAWRGFSPSQRPTQEFRGNSAHSSGYYWTAAGCMYVGGILSYGPLSSPGPALAYNAGRANSNSLGSSAHGLSIFNDTKLFLCNNVALQHWGMQPQIYGFETHDFGTRGLNVFGNAVINNWLVTCRTPNRPTFCNTPLCGAVERRWRSQTSVFQSYDVGQSHILVNLTFRDCSPVATADTPSFELLEMLTHSDRFTPDAMIATAGLKYERSGDASSRLRLGMTVNATPATWSGRMQNWLDADGSLSGRGAATILGSAVPNARDWWRLDTACTLRADWLMWACDATAPSRSVGNAAFLFDAATQMEPALGTTVCSNGNYASVPCPTIGRAWHLGYLPEQGVDLALNAKLAGPTGGFGWVIGGDAWRAPVTLNLTQIQAEGNSPLILVLPYPPGSQFRITAYSSNAFWNAARLGRAQSSRCFSRVGPAVIDNLCMHAFAPAASVEAVRAGAGDTFFFDGSTGHLYLRYAPFDNSDFLGAPNGTNNRQWRLPTMRGWAALGLELPPRGVSMANVISIVTDCGGDVDATGMFCAPAGGNGGALPASPCPGAQLPLDAYDACLPLPSPSAAPASTETPSPAQTPSPADTQTAPATPSGTTTRSGTRSRAAAAATPSGTTTRSGTRSRAAATATHSSSTTQSATRSRAATTATATSTASPVLSEAGGPAVAPSLNAMAASPSAAASAAALNAAASAVVSNGTVAAAVGSVLGVALVLAGAALAVRWRRRRAVAVPFTTTTWPPRPFPVQELVGPANPLTKSPRAAPPPPPPPEPDDAAVAAHSVDAADAASRSNSFRLLGPLPPRR